MPESLEKTTIKYKSKKEVDPIGPNFFLCFFRTQGDPKKNCRCFGVLLWFLEALNRAKIGQKQPKWPIWGSKEPHLHRQPSCSRIFPCQDLKYLPMGNSTPEYEKNWMGGGFSDDTTTLTGCAPPPHDQKIWTFRGGGAKMFLKLSILQIWVKTSHFIKKNKSRKGFSKK